MSVGVIEISGNGVTVHGESSILLESPAFATADGSTVSLGSNALAQARLKPTETCTRFWDQLAVEPLRKPFFSARHHADIAYWHLRHVWEQVKADIDEVILALPGTFEEAQLGILLGIAKSLEIPVTGLIDAALAACDAKACRTPVQLHLDIELHRIVLTRLTLNSQLKRSDVTQLLDSGLMQLQQRWMNVIRDSFVRTTRFDPMHKAHTEQQLYAGLHDWSLRLLRENTIPLELSANGRTYGITLNRDDLVHSAAEIYAQILRLITDQTGFEKTIELHLSHRVWSLPGMTESLNTTDSIEADNLDPHAVARGAIKHQPLMRKLEDPRYFITQLPRATIDRPTGKDENRPSTPTHILYRAQAHPIGHAPLILGAEATSMTRSLRLRGPLNGISRRHCSIYAQDGKVWIEDHSTYGTFLNEQKIDERTSLQVGDKIRIGTPGEVLLLIAEINPDAT